MLLKHKCIQLYFPLKEKLFFATHFFSSPSSSKQARRAICYLIHFQEQKPDALAIVIGTFEHFLITNSVSVFTKCQQFGPDRKTGTENCYSISSTTKIKTFLVILLHSKVHIIRHLLGSFFHGRAIWKNILVIQFERSSGKMEQWQELEKNIVIFQCYLTDTCNTQKRLLLVGGKIRWRIHTS